ncbi:MAG TPA: amino acid adenylation domain-containing protein [Longimicrobium sp.]|nr:amino acid adenylation domain-containing protein [Longimicrobium sp.]
MPRGGPLPLSFAQERLWFLHRMDPGSAVYNLPTALRLSGALDVAALERALGEVVRRHEPLRTVFGDDEGGPVQTVRPFAGFALPVHDLAPSGEEAAEAEARRRAADEAARPFDLRAEPPFRAALLRLGGAEHVLLLTLHHIAGDGWSTGVLARELSALYAAYSDGRESPLAELPVQYADDAAWQRAHLRGEALEAPLAWWRERLAGAPALLELPTDHPRPAVRSHQGVLEPVELSAALADRLRALARAEGATPFMVILAAFQALLGRYAGTDDVVVGSPVAGRTRREVEGLIGFFVNTLVLRTDLSGDPSFRELLGRVRQTTLGAYDHQSLPFEKLVEELHPERSLGRTPLFQVTFALDQGEGAWEDLAGVRVRELPPAVERVKFDLSLSLSPRDGGLGGYLAYSTELFERATVRRVLARLERVLEQVSANPGVRLSALELLDGDERRLLLETWSGAAAAGPVDGSIHALFQAQAARTPDAVALIGGDGAVSYAELDARANRLARHLAARGVGPETRVGVCLERGVEVVVSVLAILKAGGAYVPLDPGDPAERLRAMMDDAAVAVLVTDRAGPRALAYVMYTSGSTGTPRGVAVEHRGVVRLVRGAGYVSLGPDETILQAAPVSFDASTLEVWGALLNGGRLALLEGGTPSAGELGRALVRHGVTTVWLTAGLFQVMVEERLDDLAGVRQLLAGGDVLSVEAVRRVRERFPALRLVNGYGPTENTTFTCCHTIDDRWDGGPVPIGTPISRTTVYVLDGAMRPVPAGVPGELYAGGAGVARGYLDRPALTAEKFVPDPFGTEPGARLYRTGDRVRWREARTGERAKARERDGSRETADASASHALQFLGRLDAQVKVRGFRIEPGEIEAALRRHPGVAECAVAAREDAPGGRRLVAYVVGVAEAGELRAHLRRTLPDYMVPAAFVRLERLPLTANGKVDRGALPAPEYDAGEAFVAPRTPVEEALAEIWAEVLGRDRVSVHENFFDAGGHSLLAMRLVSRVRDALGAELPLRAVFEGPTVAGLAGRVEALRRAGRPGLAPAVPVAQGTGLPLSFAQERLWFLDRLQPGSAFYNVGWALRLRGALNAPALERALGEVVRRHDALRTAFPEADGAPVQVVAPFAGFALAAEEVEGSDPEAREAELRRRMAAQAQRPFDLAAGPLLRARLLRLAADEHVLLVCMHHIVTDGWSLRVLHAELAEAYAAFREGREPVLPVLSLQYADYAARQRAFLQGAALEEQLAFWRQRLAGAPALLELPADHPRPAVQSYRGATERIALPPALLQRLRQVGRSEHASAFMVLLTAFKMLLARYTGTTDLVVGTLVAGRTRRELEGLVGFFVNTVALRSGLSGDPGFVPALRRVRASTLEAFEHQELPFEKVVEALQPERSLGHAPLFQVSFRLSLGGEGAPLAGLETRSLDVDLPVTKFDLSATFAVGSGGFGLELEYATDLFERSTIVRMAGHLRRILEQVAADPEVRLSRLDLLDADERRRVLEEWNPPAAGAAAACIHHLFQAQAARTPHAAAVVFRGQPVTYAELESRANRLAHHLRARGVCPEACVGVCLERTPELIAALLAVLKAGGAYVPMDPAYPRERLEWMAADAGVHLALTSAALASRLPGGTEAVCIDTLADALSRLPDHAPEGGAAPGNLSHVIFTSGSTGRPKGVMIRHAAAAARLHWLRDVMDDGERAGVLGSTSVNFDVSVAEIFGTLCWGGTLVLMENALELPRAAAAVPVRSAFMVPSAAAELLRSGGIPPGLRTLMLGGEALAPGLARGLYAAGTVARVVNLYGPTEDTTYSTGCVVEPGAARVRIGRALPGGRTRVLDAALGPVPPGVPGELYLGGVGVARGYASRPGLTAERFLPDPFGPPGSRMYRTMDLARWTPAGLLEYLGRTDFQVKVRGFRVELGEIESVLRAHAGVREAVAVARDEAGGRRIVAYVTGGVPAAELRAHLRERLPGYMVPSAFVALDQLPLTSSGKIDRPALPAPSPAQPPSGGRLEPETEMESRVAALWRELLDLPAVGVEESFFDVGGHSLLLARLQSRLERELGSGLSLVELFQYPTVRAIAGRLQGAATPAPVDAGVERGSERQAALARLGGRRRR